MSEIRFISSQSVDTDKWNLLISEADNGLIYAYSWYLDHMCDSWNACIYGDYEAVMPLPGRSKYGFNYVYQPAFIQQLGVVSRNDHSDYYLNAFLPLLKKKYSYIDCKLNFHHSSETCLNNYTLALSEPFEQLQQGFNRSFREAFKQSKKTEGKLVFSNDLDNALVFNAKLYDYRSVKIEDYSYARFAELCAYLKHRNQCIIPTWMSDQQVIAQAILLKDNKRYYLMTSACLEQGRALRANHALMYYLLESLSGEEMLFDFEGSNIPGVAKFYESMGGQLEKYPALKCNFLPQWLKWLK